MARHYRPVPRRFCPASATSQGVLQRCPSSGHSAPGIASHVGRQAPAPVTHDAVLGDLRVVPLKSPLERWPSCPASAAQALPTFTKAMCGRPRPPAFGLAAQLSKITWLAWHLPGAQNVQIRTAPASSDPSAKRLGSGQSDCPHIRLE